MRAWRRMGGWKGVSSISVLCAVLLVSAEARAQSFAGTFAGEGNEKIVLTQKGTRVSGQVVVAGMKGKLSGKASGSHLTGRITLPWGDAAGFSATLSGSILKLTLQGDPTVGVYRRVGAAPARPAGGRSKPSPTTGGRAAPTARADRSRIAERYGASDTAVAERRAPPEVNANGGGDRPARGATAKGRAYRSQYQGRAFPLATGWAGQGGDGGLEATGWRVARRPGGREGRRLPRSPRARER